MLGSALKDCRWFSERESETWTSVTMLTILGKQQAQHYVVLFCMHMNTMH